jgi:hypothetical protein
MERYETYHKPKKHHFRFIIFILFLGILGFVLYTSFGNNLFLTGTGSTIQSFYTGEPAKTIQATAELSGIPVFDLNGNYPSVAIEGGSNSFMNVGNQKADLSKSKNNYLTFTNFNGKISISGSRITSMKGTASAVFVNGVSIDPSKNSLKFSLDSEFNYNSLEIKEGASISKLSYLTSGLISVNNKKNIFNVNNEVVSIGEYSGSLSISKNELLLDGALNSLRISGDSNVDIKA